MICQDAHAVSQLKQRSEIFFPTVNNYMLRALWLHVLVSWLHALAQMIMKIKKSADFSKKCRFSKKVQICKKVQILEIVQLGASPVPSRRTNSKIDGGHALGTYVNSETVPTRHFEV